MTKLLLLLFLVLNIPDLYAEKLKVGMLLTLSSDFKIAGKECRQSIEAGLKDTGKEKDFDLVFADSKNDPIQDRVVKFPLVIKTL